MHEDVLRDTIFSCDQSIYVPKNAAMDVHYVNNDGQKIKLTLDEFITRYQDGSIDQNPLVWMRDMDQWQPLIESPLREYLKDIPPPLPKSASLSSNKKEEILFVVHQETAIVSGSEYPDPVAEEFSDIPRPRAIEKYARKYGLRRYDVVLTNKRLIYFPVERETGLMSLRDGHPDGNVATLVTIFLGGVWITEAVRSILKKFKPGQQYDASQLDDMIRKGSGIEMYFERIKAVKLGRMGREMLVYKGSYVMRIEGYDGCTGKELNIEFGAGSSRRAITNTFFKKLPFPVDPEFID